MFTIIRACAGKLLRVNLTAGTIVKEDIPESYLRDYLGGAGLAAKYLYHEIPPDSDVFDENNKLFISVGPLNGKNFPTSGRFNVSCRSPLTGIWLDSSCSGWFGLHLKKAGYDAIIIEGKSKNPVYLYVNNDDVQLRDASKVWGKVTSETFKGIYDECGIKDASCCAIGPAGEKMVKMACIISNKNKAAGRGGAGALMGSKMLKAIFVYGDQDVETSDEAKWTEVLKEINARMRKNEIFPALKAYGTNVGMAGGSQTGDVPTKNWQLGTWDKYMEISGITMAQTMLKEHPPQCYACPIGCARYVEIENGPYQMKGEGPEYETCASFGSMCLNDNLESIAYANLLCTEYGLDTISSGVAVAFAMEAFETGILSPDDTGGIDLTWGNADGIIALLRKIAAREGLGEILGQGVRKASEILGRGSENFAIHVKGMEMPMHDPRAMFSIAVSYATSPRGACHLHGMSMRYEGGGVMPEAGLIEPVDPHALTGKGFLAKIAQDFASVINSSTFCMFTTFELGPTDVANALAVATGLPYDAQSVLKTGERIVNLQRAFNNRFGITQADDILPKRILTSVEEGPNVGFIPNLDEQLSEYYGLRGWESDGKPSKSKLIELGLDFVIDDLYK